MSTTRAISALAFAALLVLQSAGCASSEDTAASAAANNRADIDTLFINGNVLTFAASNAISGSPNRAQTVAVRGDTIVAVGDATLRDKFDAKQTIDLKGATLMPGFNDTHIHINGNAKRYIDLTDLTSIEEMKERVASRAKQLGKGEWITGYGWSEDELAESRKPTKYDLDSAAPANPVVLTRAGAHSAVASSRALALAGFERSSADPDNGVLERDANDDLTGIIRERQDILLALVPPAKEQELETSLARNLQQLFAHGITSITQAMADEERLKRWHKLYRDQPEKLPRASVQFVWPGKLKFLKFEGRSGDGDKHFRLGPLKVFVDGGFTGPAAYTKEPYRGETDYRGKLALTEQELAELIDLAHARGWQLGIHAIGDAAIELAVSTLSDTLKATPRTDHRHYLNHFTVMPSHETMKTMAKNGIWISQQPNFTYTLEGRYRTYLDGQRLEKNNPLRTPMEHGVFMALSSDILPIGPMTGIYAAVTRRGMSGAQYAPEEALSVLEALRAYTRHAAWFTFEESIKGTIEPGKLADLIVMPADPLSIPHDDLLGLEVEQTWLGGRLVYERAN